MNHIHVGICSRHGMVEIRLGNWLRFDSCADGEIDVERDRKYGRGMAQWLIQHDHTNIILVPCPEDPPIVYAALVAGLIEFGGSVKVAEYPCEVTADLEGFFETVIWPPEM